MCIYRYIRGHNMKIMYDPFNRNVVPARMIYRCNPEYSLNNEIICEGCISFIYNDNVLGIMITLCSIRGQFVFEITYI